MVLCLRKTTLATALAILMAPLVASHALAGHLQEAKPVHTATAQEPKPESAAQKAESEIKKEAKGSSNEEAVRNSWFVRWLSNKTGLSLDAAYWLCVVFNFAIVFFFLSALLKKKLPVFFKSRTELIQKRIEEARQASEDARRRLVEVEGRLSRLDVEITGMQREAEENARAEERRVAAAVEQERRRIVESAEQEISMAANAARRELRAFAADLAVDMAEKRIQVGKDADQALVREFTGSLGKDGN